MPVVRQRAQAGIGNAAPLVRTAVADLLPVMEARTMREAVEKGFEAAAPDGVVLLAPACASFDWFRDYAERGKAYRYYVENSAASPYIIGTHWFQMVDDLPTGRPGDGERLNYGFLNAHRSRLRRLGRGSAAGAPARLRVEGRRLHASIRVVSPRLHHL